MRKCGLKRFFIWKFDIKKRRAKRLDIVTAAGEMIILSFMRKGGQDDERFWVLGRPAFLRQLIARCVSSKIGKSWL